MVQRTQVARVRVRVRVRARARVRVRLTCSAAYAGGAQPTALPHRAKARLRGQKARGRSPA